MRESDLDKISSALSTKISRLKMGYFSISLLPSFPSFTLKGLISIAYSVSSGGLRSAEKAFGEGTDLEGKEMTLTEEGR
jgi:hypothetical protein